MSPLTVGVLLVYLIGSAVGEGCLHSLQCAQDTCCRSGSGTVLSSWPFGPLIQSEGTCSPRKAQKGENCDSHCTCDTGLECYQPVTGVCCAPHTCHDADWVAEQREYWANCHPPDCQYPV